MTFKTTLGAVCALALALFSVAPRPAVAHRAHTDPASQTKPPERFALLVGIDNYDYVGDLQGCVQDVKDMQEVLVKKFQFPAGNISTLIDRQATHEGIVNAFKTHLIENARRNPNAVVVFQYSGHGSQVADSNGDEGDNDDETLVPVNSRDPEEKNFDITDDELDELFEQLSQHSSNITFILDSCHSGSATRGEKPLDRRLVVREVKKDTRKKQPAQKPLAGGRVSGAKRDSSNIEVLPRNERYVTISGCHSTELPAEISHGKKHNGAMTFYLVDALKAAQPETTYRELMERVAQKVTSYNSEQHPQVEGDLRRAVFAGSATREDPFIKVVGVKGRLVTLGAGAAQGLKKGMLVGLYASDARRLVGEEKKLANADLIRVDALTATAQLPEDKQVDASAKAVVVTPALEPLRVALADSSAELRAKLAGQLKDNTWLQVMPGAANAQARQTVAPEWDVAITRGEYGATFRNALEVAPSLLDGQSKQPAANESIYYIAARNGQPMYGFFVKADDPEREQKIASALDKAAKQRSLIALSNDASPLKSGIRVTMLRVFGQQGENGFVVEKDEAGNPREEEIILPASQLRHALDTNVRFRIKVENLSDQDLYVTVFDVGTDGAIDMMYPSPGAKELVRSGTSIKTPLYRLTGPAGEETFKVIATTDYTDFSFLTQAGVRRGGPQSSLEWLMKQAGTTTRGEKVREVKVDQWGTAQINVTVNTAN